jgi:hypothetical protein
VTTLVPCCLSGAAIEEGTRFVEVAYRDFRQLCT